MIALTPLITTKGLAAVFNATNDGLSAKITHIGLGEHGRTPSKLESGLTQERMRIPIADGQRIDDTQIHVSALADGDKEFWIKEIGFFLEDGTMLAVWSDVKPLAYKSALVPLLLGFDLKLEALPAQSVTIVSTGANLSLAIHAETLAKMSAAIISNMNNHIALYDRVTELENATK